MKKFKPRTPSLRGTQTVSYRGVLTTSTPHKALTRGAKRFSGRNHHGRITTRHQGGGHKRRYRLIDFTYNKIGIPARIETIEYDPYRSAFISLVCYADGERRYVLAEKTSKVGDTLLTATDAPLKAGSRMMLKDIPAGTFVYNVEIKAGGGAKLGRSAGNHIEIAGKDSPHVLLKMPSGEIRKVNEKAWGSIGEVSNDEHKLRNIGKAGRSRWLGIRPTVRGSAMNPVDHPYGGGEGRQPRGTRRAKTLWGKPSGKGQKTRRPKKYSNVFIVSRRKNKKRK